MSEDPNTYDRPPDSSINDNHVNDSSDSEPTPKNSPPENGDLSVSSTGNRRHSESHLVNETFKSVVERTIDDTVTEKPKTNTFHILKSFYDKGLQTTMDFSDDVTVGNTSDLTSQRFSMMYVVPGTE